MTPHDVPPAGGDTGTEARFVAIPARARDEIGELAFYLDQVRQNLLTVNAHLSGSSVTMPSVVRDLKEIVRMTEAATVQVLEEAEALLDEGQACSALIAQAQRAADDAARPEIATPLAEVQSLVERGNDRVMAIMSALEFQDLTSQKIQRAFEVLEEVNTRLAKIHRLVALGGVMPTPGEAPADEQGRSTGKSGQDLADDILLRFQS
jgi:chemotaxis regulatin CheY-phosphate phosphatase CheZ